jgi:hypothetical protein
MPRLERMEYWHEGSSISLEEGNRHLIRIIGAGCHSPVERLGNVLLSLTSTSFANVTNDIEAIQHWMTSKSSRQLRRLQCQMYGEKDSGTTEARPELSIMLDNLCKFAR